MIFIESDIYSSASSICSEVFFSSSLQEIYEQSSLYFVYTVSIVGFYLFLKSYQKELINNFDNKILNKQIENIMEISELKNGVVFCYSEKI